MKNIAFLLLSSLICFGCNGQNKPDDKKADAASVTQEQPKGNWKVNREFDKDGNLIRYDSIYTWSSSDYADKLDRMDKDSLLQSFTSRFSGDFSPFNEEDFHSFFADDSLFTQRFFKEDFFESPIGKDFMDLDEIQKRMLDMQKKFLEQYGQKPQTQEPKQS
ncbi:hypothetical protein [Flagellimonas pelagia]|uniref:Uncharacterized protein n=1 Tax=Flagellimonas pelagia TaxID=2306998 RepID=A0A3A1NKJ4_9FLAO|nr:hypothetical protein [Allomuricauda maritima]RIV44164.1 hypothetical protein D2V05_11800 [Allomuricauda maritima]TXJ94075.1 hypothetical protein FQ017_11690 [Allomuricauda maritima]